MCGSGSKYRKPIILLIDKQSSTHYVYFDIFDNVYLDGVRDKASTFFMPYDIANTSFYTKQLLLTNNYEDWWACYKSSLCLSLITGFMVTVLNGFFYVNEYQPIIKCEE